MASIEINVQEVDYDIYGKCSDLRAFLRQKNLNQISEKQIKAVAQLANTLIQILKESGAQNLLTQPEYHDILYIAKNNLQSNLKVIQKEKQQFEAMNFDLQNTIKQQSKIIEQLNDQIQAEQTQNNRLYQENKANKDFIEQIQEDQEQSSIQLQEEYNNLICHNKELQNEVNKLNCNLNQQEQKIKNQEGEIKQLELKLNQYKNDNNQDQKHELFEQNHDIFLENEKLKIEINELKSQQNPQQKSDNEEDSQQSENTEELNPQFIQNLQEIKSNIQKDFNYLFWLIILLSFSYGVSLILKLNE
ncbi:unnamed protein product [Paramecium sonneborni]|uniref:Uncharacterized protein n=1 Tax=Paramecium sonneborni TaxID=65129 RepID=A0A8S1ND87_9CILI|nr:unnamed protein product [Paramecium sonneborni]